MQPDNFSDGLKTMSIKVKQRNAQPVSRLLSVSSRSYGRADHLSPLLGKAQTIARAQQQLDHHLPDELKNHVLVGGYTDGNLTIITDKAVWLTWLRFERMRLITLLNALPELNTVRALTFKVRPIHATRPAIRQPRSISTNAAEQLNECADYMDDPKLQAALRRLASHAES